MSTSESSLGCSGTSTYSNSLSTAFVTVTEGYDVTLSASDGTATAPTIIITDQTACSATFAPVTGSTVANTCVGANCPFSVPQEGGGTTLGTGTTTVYVTKKTPVGVIQQTSSAPPLFQAPSTAAPAPQPVQSAPPQAAASSPTPAPPQAAASSPAPAPPKSDPTSPAVASQAPAPSKQEPSPVAVISQASRASDQSPAPKTSLQAVQSPEPTPIPAAPSPSPAAPSPQTLQSHEQAPATQNNPTPSANQAKDTPSETASLKANGADDASSNPTPSPAGPSSQHSPDGTSPIIMKTSDSAVVIGSSTIPIPNRAAGTEVTMNGKTYTVQPSRVIGPGTTMTFAPGPTTAEDKLAFTTPSYETRTVGGATVSIGATAAVISGHTYSIGPNAKPTTIVANGQTISIGNNGVGFASTTFAPVKATPIAGAGVLSAVTAGGLTFSVDSTAAVISGTTYKIGPGSSPKTTVVDGHTVSLGPSGVGLASTTVNPATMTFASSNSSPTDGSGGQDGGGSPFGSSTGSGMSGRDIAFEQLMMPIFLALGLVIMI